MRSGLLSSTLASLLAVLGAGCAAPPPTQNLADLRVGQVELDHGDPASALAIAQAALAGNRRSAAALVLAGNAQYALGQTTSCEASWRQALAIDARATGAALGLARLRLRHDPAGARSDLLALAARNPGDGRIRTDIGVSYDYEGQYGLAQAQYRDALRMNPSLLSAQADLGLSLALSGQVAEATAMLAPLALAHPDNERVRHDLDFVQSLPAR